MVGHSSLLIEAEMFGRLCRRGRLSKAACDRSGLVRPPAFHRIERLRRWINYCVVALYAPPPLALG